MYSIDGAFGQIRSAAMPPSMQEAGLFSTKWIGWHRCNDLYHISRPGGFEYHLILVTVAGCGRLQIRDREYRLTPGTVAIVPRNIPHAYQTPKDGSWEFYWMHPDGALADRFLDALVRKEICVKQVDDVGQYGTKMERIMALCKEKRADTAYRISSELSSIFHDIALQFHHAGPQTLSEQAMQYLEAHYKEPLKLDRVAAELFVSVPYLIRVFRREVGCTPHQYLLKHRLSCALFYLKLSDLSVDEIAAMTGFSSASHFISLFRSQYGCTPGQYRTDGPFEGQT